MYDEDISNEAPNILRDYQESFISCDSDTEGSVNTHRAVDQRRRPSLWVILKASLQSTILCGILVGLFGTLLWWLELNVKAYCFTEWNKIPENIHRRRLIVDIFIATVAHFWVFSCLAPICEWQITKKLSLIYICTIAALLDAIVRLLLFIFAYYSYQWKHYIGCMIFLMASFIMCYRLAWHCKANSNRHYNVFVLTLKMNLQFILGLLVAIPFNLLYLDLYYKSSFIEKTILACALIIVFAIPKLFINHVISKLHGVCLPGDEIMLVIAYMTATTICARLMQAKIEKLSYFIVISIVHGLLNILDKVTLSLRRKVLSCMCCNRKQNGIHQHTFADGSFFLANQTLLSIITETTSVIVSSAAAHLLLYYYKKEESTGELYNGYSLFKDMVIRCSIAIGIELIFNAIAVKVQSHLYKIPVINVWKRKWKSILLIHMIQVLFIVLYFSQFINNILLKGYYKDANITCFGFFKRI